MRRLSLTVLVLAAAAACASRPEPPPVVAAQPPPPAPPGPPPPTIEREWRLAYMDGSVEAPSGLPTLKLSADTVNGMQASGFAGCGAFSGAAPLKGISIKFDPITPSDAPDCTAGAKLVQSQFVSALGAARRVTIRSGYLVLIDEFGRDRLYFTPG